MSLVSPAGPPRASLARAVRLTRRLLVGLAAALASLCLCLWLTLYWGILPRLDDWRPRIEQWAGGALGLEVRIGRIAVESTGWVPTFQLSDIVLRDRAGREALRVPHLRAALSLPPLLVGKLRFDGLRVDGLALEVRRDRQGRIHVAGLDVTGAEQGSAADVAAAADWFFEQREFAIEHGAIRWIDEARAAPPLQLGDVRLVVRNGLRRHALRLDATPPPAWGERFTLIAQASAPLLARAGDWRRWKVALYALLPRVDAAQLDRYVALPFALERGSGALRAWVDVDAMSPRAATLDLALREVALRLQPRLDPLALGELTGRLAAQRAADGVAVQASGLAFTLPDGRRWPASRLALSWRQAQAPPDAPMPPVTGGEFEADRLDLALLAELAGRLPLGAGVRRLLAELDPVGELRDLRAGWDGSLDMPTHYRARARALGLAIRAAAAPDGHSVGRPGWRGAEVEFSASEVGGDARLHIADGAVEFPGVFEDPRVPVRRLDARLHWRIDAPGPGGAPRVELQVADMRFENEDGSGELQAAWHTGAAPGFGRGATLPGVLDLSGKLTRGRATRVARYLPLEIHASVRDWVRGAVRGGEVADVDFRLRGDLEDFPYINRKAGDFRIAGRVEDVTLAPLPGADAPDADPHWPAFTHVHGELVFERRSMHFERVGARLWDTDLADVRGGIRELGPRSMLEIEGHARGPAADLLRYIAATPIGGWLAGALAQTSAAGSADSRLALHLPIAHPADATLHGSVQLAGGDLRLRDATPLLAAAHGRIDFSQAGFQIVGAGARLAGGEVAVEGGSQSDGSLRVVASGRASADGLRRLPELAAYAPLLARLAGGSAYRLEWVHRDGAARWDLASTLAGMAIDLPAPLGKPDAATLPLRVAWADEPRASRDRLRIDLGQRLLSAQLLRDTASEPPRPLAGALALGAPLPDSVPGLQAAIDLPRLDLDAWRSVLGAAGTGAAGAWPREIALKTPELVVGGRRLSHVDAKIVRLSDGAAYGAGGWQADLQSDQASGRLTYREPRAGSPAGRLYARLSRLALPPSSDDGIERLLDRHDGALPALDIEVDAFELGARKLGALVVDAYNLPAAGEGGRGAWQLERLSLRVPEATLQASGQWTAPVAAGPRRMALDFKLDLTDAGDLVERLGFGRVLSGGKGRLAGRVAWSGSPLQLDLPTLEGRMTLALDNGRFLQVDPGVGRLLGVLSLQALPRRLTLDFSDLFGKGFAFDNASGDVDLAHGSARTNNLRFRGLQAAVLMDGSVDLVRETEDLYVVVVPEINAGTASLAYAAIHPAIGLGTFLAQYLLRAPLREASTREFRITGPWADPQIARVARLSAAAASSPTSPPPARSASAP